MDQDEHSGPEPDWLATGRWRYLHDADFHAVVEVVVRERYADELEAKDRRIAELEAAYREPYQPVED